MAVPVEIYQGAISVCVHPDEVAKTVRQVGISHYLQTNYVGIFHCLQIIVILKKVVFIQGKW